MKSNIVALQQCSFCITQLNEIENKIGVGVRTTTCGPFLAHDGSRAGLRVPALRRFFDDLGGRFPGLREVTMPWSV